MRSAALASALVWIATAAHAGDGRVEINQACALAGCFAGDDPGMPVQTQDARSYVLTSNLVASGSAYQGVILGAGSTLDLNGFAILGPNTCTGTPASCAQSGASGGGVVAGAGSVVKNGTIRGMRSYGIAAGEHVRIENVRIEENRLDGIRSDGDARGLVVQDCQIVRNGAEGIMMAVGFGGLGARVVRNTIYGNHGNGVAGGVSLLVDNAIANNGDYGANLTLSNVNTAYGGNHIYGNNGGNTNDQLTGGTSIGTNVCGTDTGC